ncbi:DNA helicase II [Chlorella vulgaris]
MQSAPSPTLTDEQQAAAHAPIDAALAVLAAAGTGKTTTIVARVRHILDQGVPPDQLLVLTFSRKAAAEFQDRLRRHVPGAAEAATACTFHAFSWLLIRHHWAEAGFGRRPSILAAEQQELALMTEAITWDRLAAVRHDICGWLFLRRSAAWPEIVATAAERHADLYDQCLRQALDAHQHGQQPGSQGRLTADEAAQRPFTQLAVRLQLLLVTWLHDALRRRFASQRGDPGLEGGVLELLAMADKQAPVLLKWLEGQKRRGCMPDGDMYAALCAGGKHAGECGERLKWLYRVGAAYQQELLRQNLVTLTDLPLLAKQLLARGGAALAWAQQRWRHVLCDEFQDTGGTSLDLLVLLMGERRSVTVVGDDDQAIYSFLSAEPQVFPKFLRHFGGQQLCLQTNFRSTAAICAFGGALLHGNRRQAHKCMMPARADACAPVWVRQFHTAQLEAAATASEVLRLWREEAVPYRDMCLLYRCLRLQGTQPHAPLMAALRRLRIPHVLVSQVQLSEDPGVAALCSYLAAALGSDPAFRALLSLPHHGLGPEVCGAIMQQQAAARLAGRAPPGLLVCAERLCSQAGIQQEGHRQQQDTDRVSAAAGQLHTADLRELRRLVLLLRSVRAAAGRQPLPEAVGLVLRDSGLLPWLQQQGMAASPGSESGQEAAAFAEELPAPLRRALHKAQQLMEERQGAQQEAAAASSGASNGFEAPALAGGTSAAAARGLSSSQQQQAGDELLQELLSRLAQDTAADEGCDGLEREQQQQPQQQAGEGQQGEGGNQGAASQSPGAITISTIHAAKGLEWRIVLMPSVCEGVLPLPLFTDQSQAAAAAAGAAGGEDSSEADYGACQRAHVEEERRLFHVAATRARDRLLVSYVQPPPPAAPPDPGDEEAEAAPPAYSAADAACLPQCSSILAGAVRRLRCQQEVLQLEGQLPEHGSAGTWEDSQPPGLLAHDGNSRSPLKARQLQSAPKLSVAEQVRQKLAANPHAGGLGTKGSIAKAPRRPRQKVSGEVLR